jgi:cyanophycin synthetase
MFNHIIIRQDHDLRGNTAQNIVDHLLEGIAASGKKVTYEIIPDEADAVKHALAIAEEGDLVVALTEQITKVVSIINSHKQDSVAQHV